VVTGTAVTLLLALIGVLVVLFRRRPRDEAARIQARYGALLVPVAEGPERGYETIEVTDIKTLARLSRHFDQPIMHKRSRSAHAYAVYYDGMAYRFRVGRDDIDDPVLLEEPISAVS
jgi:hypothetical protein